MELNTTGDRPFGIAVAVMVKMCGLPTSFTLASGEMVMLASGFAFVNVHVIEESTELSRLMVTPVPVTPVNVLAPELLTQLTVPTGAQPAGSVSLTVKGAPPA